jgi:hypothetical protein
MHGAVKRCSKVLALRGDNNPNHPKHKRGKQRGNADNDLYDHYVRASG